MRLVNEKNEYYEVWDMTMPDLSPRSILYNLSPIGIGTAEVESLTGYISRLAQEHSLSLVVLLKSSVRNLSELPGSILQNSISASLAGGLNGFGNATRTVIRILTNATRRNDIHLTSLIYLEKKLSNHKLLKKNSAWCSVCFDEQREHSGIIYEKLIWTFYESKACHIHELPLIEVCPHCHKKLKVLSGKSRPGFCSKCMKWLGCKLALHDDARKFGDETEKKKELWRTARLRELLTGSPFLHIDRKENFTEILNLLIKKFSYGSINNFAQLTGIWHISIRRLLHGQFLPTIEIILQICFSLNISVIELFEMQAAVEPTKSPVKILRKPADNTEMQSHIEIFLTEKPPPSLNEVSRRTSWTLPRILRNFPDEYKLIVERYSQHTKRGTPEIPDNEVEQILLEVLKSRSSPSLQSVFRDIGCSNTGYRYYQMFPELCAKISAEYNKSNHKKFDFPNSTKIIHSALEEQPPPSFSEVARRIGCTRENLKRNLPELAALIGDRYKKHLEDFRKENSRRLHETVKKILLKLQAKNSSISMNKVKRMLPRKWNEVKFKEAYREIVNEMNLITEN